MKKRNKRKAPEKLWKYSKKVLESKGLKSTLGIVSDNTPIVVPSLKLDHKEIEERPQPKIEQKPIENNDALKKEYEDSINDFKKSEREHSTFMYEKLVKLEALGRKIDPEGFTIMKLCEDLGITYNRYNYFMEYKNIEDWMKEHIKNKEISQDIVINIIHRFPKKDWKEVIHKELKYKLTRNDMVSLRARKRYKKAKNWDKIHDTMRGRRQNMQSSTNKRTIYTYCQRLITGLDELKSFNKITKKKVYSKVSTTNKKLDKWLKKHKSWNRQ